MTGRKMTLTEAGIKQRGNAALKHGMVAYERHGEAMLSDTGRGRLQELKEQFRTEPGRVEYREELAANIAILLELGFSYMREVTEAGGNLWECPPIRIAGVYLNSLIRLLDGWPKEQSLHDITTILTGEARDTEGGDHGND
jgi:hypothetical protein